MSSVTMRCDSIAVKTFRILLTISWEMASSVFMQTSKLLWTLNSSSLRTYILEFLLSKYSWMLLENNEIVSGSYSVLSFFRTVLCRNCRVVCQAGECLSRTSLFSPASLRNFWKTFISYIVFFYRVLVCCCPFLKFWVLSHESKLRWISVFSIKVIMFSIALHLKFCGIVKLGFVVLTLLILLEKDIEAGPDGLTWAGPDGFFRTRSRQPVRTGSRQLAGQII